MPFWIFKGHAPTKQSLISENDSVFLPGFAEWHKGEVREITPDMGLWLGATACFEEVPDPRDSDTRPAHPDEAPEA